ncbi:uncharacterized protein LOC122264646 [Penaeus japonicus]|uniref:uncharacterized protein LOC122264646 n=1 Tax=Penaeus japonicus TaxID=27405 RepID=UPI001C70FA95|nr:uncharacterized protein LOC122264646 [Penaeus japonicus]
MEGKMNDDNILFKSSSLGISDWTDLPSVKKCLKTTLQCLQKKHKELSLKRVQYLEKSFSLALDHHRANVKELEGFLMAIAPHTFNDHTMCKRTWCFDLQKKVNQKDKMKFTKRQLIMDLKEIFFTLASNSSELVKSFQNVSREADIADKLTPDDNVNLLQENHPLQPSNNRKRKKEDDGINDDAVQNSEQVENLKPSQKWKRDMIERGEFEPMQKKASLHIPDNGKKASGNKRNEVAGATCNTEKNTKCSDKKEPRKSKPKLEQMDINDLQSHTKVFFDLETTSLRIDCGIVQIGAIDNNEEFSIYVIPTQRIDPRASAVTGLTFRRHTLEYRGQPVYAVTRSEALHKFLEWIQLRSPVILYAHNATFDYRRFFHAIREENLVEAFKQHILGFVDTLAQFKVKFPKLPNYKQSTVVQMVLKKSYDAHNASGDVKALMELYSVSKMDEISKGSVTFSSAYEKWLFDIYGKNKAMTL